MRFFLILAAALFVTVMVVRGEEEGVAQAPPYLPASSYAPPPSATYLLEGLPSEGEGAASAATSCDDSTRFAGHGPVNLVANASFEEGDAEDAGWHRVSLTGRGLPALRDVGVARSGGCSIKLERRRDGDCVTVCGYWTSKPIAVQPATSYLASIFFRLSPGIRTTTGVYLTVRIPDGRGGYFPFVGIPARAGAEWTQALLQFTLPEGVTSVVLDVSWLDHLRSTDPEGDVWLDDVFLGPAP